MAGLQLQQLVGEAARHAVGAPQRRAQLPAVDADRARRLKRGGAHSLHQHARPQVRTITHTRRLAGRLRAGGRPRSAQVTKTAQILKTTDHEELLFTFVRLMGENVTFLPKQQRVRGGALYKQFKTLTNCTPPPLYDRVAASVSASVSAVYSPDELQRTSEPEATLSSFAACPGVLGLLRLLSCVFFLSSLKRKEK